MVSPIVESKGIRICDYDWKSVTSTPGLIVALIECYRRVFDEESEFKVDNHSPELVWDLLQNQLSDSHASGARIWIASTEWSSDIHSVDKGFSQVELNGVTQALLGFNWTTGKRTRKFIAEIIKNTSTLFESEANHKKTIQSKVDEIFESRTLELTASEAYSAEQGVREGYRDGIISSHLMNRFGEYALTLGLTRYSLWTSRSSPMFNTAVKVLNADTIHDLDDNLVYISGDVNVGLARVRRVMGMLQASNKKIEVNHVYAN